VFVVAGCIFAGPVCGQQIGKSVPIPAGSEADHAIAAITAASGPAEKLAAIDKFASGAGKEGDMAILADGFYVDYYLSQKNYDKVFDYGDKLFAVDPDNFANALNMIRAASETHNAERVLSYGEKSADILQRFKAAPPPAGTSPEDWEGQKRNTLEANKDGIVYVLQVVMSGSYPQKDASRYAAVLTKLADVIPDPAYAAQALGVAATAYQQAQNTPKMLEVANSLLAKDPNNLGMLLLLSDYYSEKGEQLDKADAYARKVLSNLETAQKPAGLADEQWATEKTLQKGLALSTLGQVSMQKKQNAQAIVNLRAAAPLLKSNDTSYARNQYRLGFALLNLKKTAEAKEAFVQAASVNSVYRALAQEKVKEIEDAARRKGS
jgi:tetratricopeptide (TPR) repeat protein